MDDSLAKELKKVVEDLLTLSNEELLEKLIEANPSENLHRTVKLPAWMWDDYYKDRHPQGVIFYTPENPEKFTVYRSHLNIEKAAASARELNRTSQNMLACNGIPKVCFEAVFFSKNI